MGSDRQHRHDGNPAIAFHSIRAVIEEYPVSPWCMLLNVSLEDFLSVRSSERPELMGLQGRVSRVRFQERKYFANLLEKTLLARMPLQLLEDSRSFGREPQLAVHSSSAYCANEPR